MNINLTEGDDHVVAHLQGVVDERAKDRFDEYLHPIISTPGRRLVLDLAASPRISSMGVGLLVTLVSRANTKGSRVVLASPSPFVASILEVTKLSKFFDIEDTVEAAVESLRKG